MDDGKEVDSMNWFFFLLIVLLVALVLTGRMRFVTRWMGRSQPMLQGRVGMKRTYAALTVMVAMVILLGTALAVSFSAMMKSCLSTAAESAGKLTKCIHARRLNGESTSDSRSARKAHVCD
jgi:hypothetical protein